MHRNEIELQKIQRAARAQMMTVSEWVRQTLRAACSPESSGDAIKKLDIVRTAASHSYPTADIDQMIVEIESDCCAGKLSQWPGKKNPTT